MQWLDPIPYHIWGAHLDRDTAGNVEAAGISDVRVENLSFDVIALIEARRD